MLFGHIKTDGEAKDFLEFLVAFKLKMDKKPSIYFVRDLTSAKPQAVVRISYFYPNTATCCTIGEIQFGIRASKVKFWHNILLVEYPTLSDPYLDLLGKMLSMARRDKADFYVGGKKFLVHNDSIESILVEWDLHNAGMHEDRHGI